MKYYDVELKSAKRLAEVTWFISNNGGYTTDSFMSEDCGIFLLRCKLPDDLAESLKKCKYVKSVELPPRLQAVSFSRAVGH